MTVNLSLYTMMINISDWILIIPSDTGHKFRDILKMHIYIFIIYGITNSKNASLMIQNPRTVGS